MARSRNKAIVQQQVALRKKLWPLIEDKDLWLRNERTGFVTLPRAMPILLTIMDGMNKGKRVSSTYLDLWCRVMDEMFVKSNPPPPWPTRLALRVSGAFAPGGNGCSG